MRLLEYKLTDGGGVVNKGAASGGAAKKEFNNNLLDAEFETLLAECKKNKISQSLLLMSKTLFLNNTSFASTSNETANNNAAAKLHDEQKTLIEVT
jgi:hypothetical protein